MPARNKTSTDIHPKTDLKMVTRSFPVRSIDSLSYKSVVMGADYDICVGLPLQYAEHPEKQYPMLVVLDGNDHFSTVNSLARGMLEDIGELIVVGVDIPVELDNGAYQKRRVHQFSPDNQWPMTDAFGAFLKTYIEEVLESSAPIKDCIGGAASFYDFLVSELIPDLYQAYRIDTTDLGLAGNSAAGFFTSYAMLKEESPFGKYIISSPAMAYGDGEIFRIEERWQRSHSDLQAKVYMGAGSRELNSERFSRSQIVGGMTKLTGQFLLRNYPSLEIQADIYEGIGHVDSLAVTVARGLRYLFKKE